MLVLEDLVLRGLLLICLGHGCLGFICLLRVWVCVCCCFLLICVFSEFGWFEMCSDCCYCVSCLGCCDFGGLGIWCCLGV